MRVPCIIIISALIALAGPAVAADRLTVFAAASLGDVMRAMGAAFTRANGTEVRFSFAASSTLARQIEAGAPADIYASANTGWMTYLQERGLVAADSIRIPVRNSLALVGNRARFAAAQPLAQALEALRPGERMVIGDPAHVPAGIYARQALTALGLWDGMQPRLAYASDVRAALALVARGEAPLGLTYLTDIPVGGADVVLLEVLDPALHQAIAYPFAIVSGHESPATQAFMAFLDSETGRRAFREAGFRPAAHSE